MKDDLRWKKTLRGRRSSVEDNLWWRTTFGGRWPSVEEDLLCKMIFVGRRPLVEDYLWWIMTFSGRQPLWILAYCLLRFAALFCLSLSFDSFPSPFSCLSPYLESFFLNCFNLLARIISFRKDWQTCCIFFLTSLVFTFVHGPGILLSSESLS